MTHLSLKVREWKPEFSRAALIMSSDLWITLITWHGFRSELYLSESQQCSSNHFLKPVKPLNSSRVYTVISYRLFPLGHMHPLKLDAMPLLRKLQACCQSQPPVVTCATKTLCCRSVDPSPFWKPQVWNKKEKSENRILMGQRLVPGAGVILR